MEVPSWVNPAPLAFGTSKHGKLSADQWRTVSLINLPISLIRTWGLEEGRRYDMLVNFLHLVEAVATLGYLEADKDSLALADELLLKYLEGVKELYKGAKIVPNHHLALHLTMFITLFGPVQPIVVPSPPFSFSTASLLRIDGSLACGRDTYGVTCSSAGALILSQSSFSPFAFSERKRLKRW